MGSGLMSYCIEQFPLVDWLCKNALTSCAHAGIVTNTCHMIRLSKFFLVAHEVTVAAVFILRLINLSVQVFQSGASCTCIHSEI